ncbi:MAG: isochorismatase family protein [Gammaproteobacteria bacterium]|nr:isochorismatase family protein [Gammaproteobacteria bacterium]
MELTAKRTALLVIDMQNGFCKTEGSAAKLGFDIQQCLDAIQPNLKIIDAARAKQLPIIYTRLLWRPDYRDGGVLTDELMPALAESQFCAAGTWDAELIDDIKCHDSDFIVDKNRYSGFYGTPLQSILTSHDIRSLVICGVTTNVCVETTARDASQRDYRTFIVGDACGEIAPERHEWALATLDTRFGKVVSTEDVLKAWS